LKLPRPVLRKRDRVWIRVKGQKRQMSALGQKQTSDCRLSMSAIPPKADIKLTRLHVRFVPIAGIGHSFDHLSAVNRTRHRQER
jgi:hypothetical protein